MVGHERLAVSREPRHRGILTGEGRRPSRSPSRITTSFARFSTASASASQPEGSQDLALNPEQRIQNPLCVRQFALPLNEVRISEFRVRFVPSGDHSGAGQESWPAHEPDSDHRERRTYDAESASQGQARFLRENPPRGVAIDNYGGSVVCTSAAAMVISMVRKPSALCHPTSWRWESSTAMAPRIWRLQRPTRESDSDSRCPAPAQRWPVRPIHLPMDKA